MTLEEYNERFASHFNSNIESTIRQEDVLVDPISDAAKSAATATKIFIALGTANLALRAYSTFKS